MDLESQANSSREDEPTPDLVVEIRLPGHCNDLTTNLSVEGKQFVARTNDTVTISLNKILDEAKVSESRLTDQDLKKIYNVVYMEMCNKQQYQDQGSAAVFLSFLDSMLVVEEHRQFRVFDFSTRAVANIRNVAGDQLEQYPGLKSKLEAQGPYTVG